MRNFGPAVAKRLYNAFPTVIIVVLLVIYYISFYYFILLYGLVLILVLKCTTTVKVDVPKMFVENILSIHVM